MKGLSLESFYLQSPGNIFSSSGDFWEVGNNGKAPSAVQRHKYTPNRCLNRLNIDPHYVDHKGVKIDNQAFASVASNAQVRSTSTKITLAITQEYRGLL